MPFISDDAYINDSTLESNLLDVAHSAFAAAVFFVTGCLILNPSLRFPFLSLLHLSHMARRLLMQELLAERQLHQERIFRERTNPFDVYNDVEFYARFRLIRSVVVDLVNLVRDRLEHLTARNSMVPELLQVLVALRYYATGSHLRVIGDTFGIHISTTSRIVQNVTSAIIEHLDEHVQMPTVRNIAEAKQEFYGIANFPGVIGVIDGTHIRMQRPANMNDQPFINRKGYCSINVQAVCDARRRFISICAEWPGSCHDSHVLRSSDLYQQFERGDYDGYLLGDSGYPCKTWLLTPFINPVGHPRTAYNNSLTHTRSRIEQAFGILKRRFICLHTEIRFAPGETK